VVHEPQPRRPAISRLLEPLTVGIDIGGSKVLAGVLNGRGQVLERIRRETPTTSPEEVEDAIVDIVRELGSRHPVAAVGIGAAGFVDAARASVLFSPHLAWRNEPLRDALWVRLRLPIVVDNDANAAAWAETHFGAAVGRRHLLCITLGTGIGGALVLDGRLFRGANGMAGEFGHMQVVPGGHRCECGNRGCWEQYASGNALVRDARELIVARSPVAHYLRDLVDGDADRLTGPMVSEAARHGDPAAIELITEVGDWLGTGLAGLTAAFDPDCIVVGGGVSEAGDLLLEPARESFSRTLTGRGFRSPPPIMPAFLGPDAGFIGAAELARSAARRSRRSRRSRRRGMRARSGRPLRGGQRSTRVTSNE
jgi:glucokinase